MTTTQLGGTEYREAVTSAQAGDEYAFGRLCRNWRGLCNKVVRCYVDGSVPEIVLKEEAKSALWRRIVPAVLKKDYAAEKKRAKGFIRRALHNCMIDILRRKRLPRDGTLDDMAIKNWRSQPALLDCCASWEQVEVHWRGPLAYFALLEQGYTQALAAEILKIPVQTLKTWLTQLRQSIARPTPRTVQPIPERHTWHLMPGDLAEMIELRSQNHTWQSLADRYEVPRTELRRLYKQATKPKSKAKIEARRAIAA